MLDIKAIRNEPERFAAGLRKKGAAGLLENLLDLDLKRRSLLQEVEAMKAERNRASELIAQKKRQKVDAQSDVIAMRQLGVELKEKDEVLREIEQELTESLAALPNIPAEGLPVGDESANRELRKHGTIPEFCFTPKPHWDLGVEGNWIDFERGGKVTGARFMFYRGLGSRLERALMAFMLDLHRTEHAFVEMTPPVMVNQASLYGTGQLPKLKEDMFAIDNGYYLIPTAEVPLTNYHRDDVLLEQDLPVRYVGYSTCFRSEAGAAGRDTRGVIRMHQFNKVEMVMFTHPEESYQALEELTGYAALVLEKLELPYRVLELATGDLSFASAKTYDLEVWLPSYHAYKEISSCSNFEDFQARRANIRYRNGSGKLSFVHTLNGSGLAIDRTIAAVLENFQNEDGTVNVPRVLQPYLDGLTVLTKND